MKTIQNIVLRYADLLKSEVDDDSQMSSTYLKNIILMTQELNQIIDPKNDLEDWVDAKITIAHESLSDVLTYLRK
jgi:hypothetical protein